MKLGKSLLAMCSAFILAGCTTSQGAELTVENASTYLAPLQETVLNASFNTDAKTVSFTIEANPVSGKLFSSDIKGKCSVSVKYMKGINPDLTIIWSDPYIVNDIAFAYKEGETGESGYKRADYLGASFSYSVDFEFTGVNVYNLQVSEISGHMLP